MPELYLISKMYLKFAIIFVIITTSVGSAYEESFRPEYLESLLNKLLALTQKEQELELARHDHDHYSSHEHSHEHDHYHHSQHLHECKGAPTSNYKTINVIMKHNSLFRNCQADDNNPSEKVKQLDKSDLVARCGCGRVVGRSRDEDRVSSDRLNTDLDDRAVLRCDDDRCEVEVEKSTRCGRQCGRSLRCDENNRCEVPDVRCPDKCESEPTEPKCPSKCDSGVKSCGNRRDCEDESPLSLRCQGSDDRCYDEKQDTRSRDRLRDHSYDSRADDDFNALIVDADDLNYLLAASSRCVGSKCKIVSAVNSNSKKNSNNLQSPIAFDYVFGDTRAQNSGEQASEEEYFEVVYPKKNDELLQRVIPLLMQSSARNNIKKPSLLPLTKNQKKKVRTRITKLKQPTDPARH